jgi:hypothetical protein
MMFAVEVNEAAALQLHATELMLLLSTAILMLVDQPSARTSVESDVRDADYALSNPSS